MNTATSTEPFKVCPVCGHVWPTRDTFLSDPDLVVKGYQANFDSLNDGLFIFLHSKPDCETGLALEVRAFIQLYKGPVFHERMTGRPACPGYCLHEKELRPCYNLCECAGNRLLLQLIRGWPKEKRS